MNATPAISTAENHTQLGSLATNSLTSGLVTRVDGQNGGGSPLFDVRFASATS